MLLNKQTGIVDMKINLNCIGKLLHTCHGGGVPLRDVSVETRGTIEHHTQQTNWICGHGNQSQTYVEVIPQKMDMVTWKSISDVLVSYSIDVTEEVSH